MTRLVQMGMLCLDLANKRSKNKAQTHQGFPSDKKKCFSNNILAWEKFGVLMQNDHNLFVAALISPVNYGSFK